MFQKQKFDIAAQKFLHEIDDHTWRHHHLWEAQEIFQKNWNPDVIDYHKMLDQCIDENSASSYLPIIHAKSSLLKMVEVNEDLVRNMFRDFFSDEKDLMGRLGRFEFHCDLLLKEIQGKYPKEFSHHHDKAVLFHYLTLRFPMDYIPFDHPSFFQMMIKLGSLQPPENYEIERYYKTIRIMHKFLVAMAKEQEKSPKRLKLDSLLLTYEFMSFLIS